MEGLQKQLAALADEKYKAFHEKLIPNIDSKRVMGIPTPKLRAFAKAFAKTEDAAVFLSELPHFYYEENNLHCFLIEQVRDYDAALALTKEMLPFIDNWATCDCFAPKVFGKHPDEFLQEINSWLRSEHTYTMRFGIVNLIRYYLGERFQPEMLLQVSGITSKDYYVQMAQAWYFSMALVKQEEAALPCFTQHKLEPWVHNKALQKARESLRVSKERKEYYQSLKI